MPRILPSDKNRRASIYLLLGIIGLIAITACGSTSGAANETTPKSATLPTGYIPNWKNPIGGKTEPSASAVQRKMPFPLRRLAGTQGPSKILLTPGRPSSMRVVVLQYQEPVGLVDIYEETAQISASSFQAVINHWVGLNGKEGTRGTTTDVRVHSKYPAMVTTTGSGRSAITWIEDRVQYTITGPSLRKADCVKLANQLTPIA